jgi:hypothetical protein
MSGQQWQRSSSAPDKRCSPVPMMFDGLMLICGADRPLAHVAVNHDFYTGGSQFHRGVVAG